MDTPEWRAAYNACLPKLSDYETELGHNLALQQGYAALKAGPDWAHFNTAQRKLIDDALRDFHLAGVDLPADKKARLRDMSQQLSKLTAKFGENVLDATQGWFKHVSDEAGVAGIPVIALEQAREAAANRKLEGYVFTLDYPSYAAVITYAEDRELRAGIRLRKASHTGRHARPPDFEPAGAGLHQDARTDRGGADEARPEEVLA